MTTLKEKNPNSIAGAPSGLIFKTLTSSIGQCSFLQICQIAAIHPNWVSSIALLASPELCRL